MKHQKTSWSFVAWTNINNNQWHQQQPMDATVEYSIKTSPWKMETTIIQQVSSLLMSSWRLDSSLSVTRNVGSAEPRNDRTLSVSSGTMEAFLAFVLWYGKISKRPKSKKLGSLRNTWKSSTFWWRCITWSGIRQRSNERVCSIFRQSGDEIRSGITWKRYKPSRHRRLFGNDDTFGDDIWVLTVDGTHCWLREPQHPVWSQDPEWYSHKFNKAGVNYELGISISQNRLVWMNGPFKAGLNDITIFTNEGLKEKLRATGKKAIGDGGYSGHSQQISTPNSHDSKPRRGVQHWCYAADEGSWQNRNSKVGV